jgi:hypothetical protein
VILSDTSSEVKGANSGPSITCTRVAEYGGKMKRGVVGIRFRVYIRIMSHQQFNNSLIA